jgi:hypothetical protein
MSELPYATWETPPIPAEGDLDREHTYAGVGRVLSEWEGAEAALSHLYAWFVGKLFQAEAYHEYGAGQIFRERMRTFKTGRYTYFVQHPSQPLEGRCDCLAALAEKFSARRNEVAHSVVGHIWNGQKTRHEYLLMPPLYDPQRFSPPNDQPGWAYTSISLAHLKEGLWVLRSDLVTYLGELRSGSGPTAASSP